MRRNRTNDRSAVTRRQALAGAAATVGLGLAGAPASQSIAAALPGAKVCILTPQAVEGPFYFDPKLVRADITEGKPGAPLKLTLQVVEAKDCARLEGARVDVWHSDGLAVYSGYARQETGSTRGETFLRGTQFTDADGQVRFATIYPGWYPGRTPHIHFKVFLDAVSLVTGQLYFPDPVTEHVYATLPPYRERTAERDTFNAMDGIFRGQGGSDTLVSPRRRAALISLRSSSASTAQAVPPHPQLSPSWRCAGARAEDWLIALPGGARHSPPRAPWNERHDIQSELVPEARHRRSR